MRSHNIPAKLEEFSLSFAPVMDAVVVIPTVRSTWKMKYGEHAYYFLNFRTLTGFCVRICHGDVIRPGFARFKRAASIRGGLFSTARCFLRSYHYNFSFLEQMMLMTVPHTVTDVGAGRFLINLWSYYGYLLVDCHTKSVTYHTLEESEGDHVLGSQQWFDPNTHELYAMSYSLPESFERISNPARTVSSRIFRHKIGSAATETVWSGPLSDFLHDIVVNKDRRYGVACELGMYLDRENNIVPSKVLIVELGTSGSRQWQLDRFVVAAHAQFDPEDSEVIYFSNHNFQFEHTPLLNLLKNAAYTVKFRGPASIFKYRLATEGPREIGVFTRPDFYRLTNMHVFIHRGRKMIAAMGFPDEILLIDADKMACIWQIKVKEPLHQRCTRADTPAMIGTIAPSPDGAKLFVQTTKSFQVVDVASVQSEYVWASGRYHACSNHMLASSSAGWGCVTGKDVA
ncbi:MAG: hypothetical protein WC551_13445 [Patescibacteria group bacterium]